MSINAYAAKRALFDAWTAAAAQPGSALSGVQIAYRWPGQAATSECVYGGRITFEDPEDQTLIDGDDQLVTEEAVVWVHVRVRISPIPDQPDAADRRAEAIGDELARVAFDEPLNVGVTKPIYARVDGGVADYFADDDAVSAVLSYRYAVRSSLRPQAL